MKNKLILFTLAGVNFTHIMFTMILMPLGDLFMEEFGINALQFSHLVSVYAFAAFFSGLVGIFLMDRFNRKTTLLFLFIGFWITAAACGMVVSFEQLLLLRFCSGAFGGVIGALALAIVSDLYSYRERSGALGIIMAGFSAAAAFGIPFGLLLADWFSWRMPFFFIGGIGLLLSLFIFLSFPKIRPATERSVLNFKDNPLRKMLADGNQKMALLVAFVLVLGHFLIIPFIAPYMMRNVGFSMQEISYVYFVGGALTVFSTPLIGRITDRIGPSKALIYFMLISFVPVVVLTNLSESALLWGLVTTSAFFVFGSGRTIAPQTMITASAPPHTRGGFMSLKSSLQQLSIAAASFICGLIVTIGEDGKFINYDLVGYLSIAICMVAIWLALGLKVARGN
ncbi:MAG: MFS transporter [Saprospirales bacterium]|nr:MAG: MFS transporter [Saprospirales bacterium]